MSASLVGSEMCIRDRRTRARAPAHADGSAGRLQPRNRYSALCEPSGQCACSEAHAPVSYTHLTLPTICSV
eukprot:14078210-Alexandrium_andersonii.AAC.1